MQEMASGLMIYALKDADMCCRNKSRGQGTKGTRISIDTNHYHINYYITLFIFIRI